MDISDTEIVKMNCLIDMFAQVGAILNKGRTESVYQNALIVELQNQNIHYTDEETIPIMYKGRAVGQERRLGGTREIVVGADAGHGFGGT